jgi:photosystem II stability/assembly factor-like uncharacterized protein
MKNDDDKVVLVAAEDEKEDYRGTANDRGGIFRTTNGGTSWQRLSGFNGLPRGSATDLVWDSKNSIL